MTCGHCFKSWLLAAVALPVLAVGADLDIENGWIRAVPPVSKTTAGYFQLHNRTDQDRVLTGLTTDIAGAGELHTMAPQEDGTRRMQRLPEVPVPAGETVVFEPGAKHLMLFRLQRPLVEGEKIPLCLTFSAGEPMCAEFEVVRP